MTTKTWFGGDGFYRNGADWSPSGVPQAGNSVIVAAGTLHASGRTLSGLTIRLEGTSDSGAPVLALRDVTLDSSINMAGLPASPGGYGTIDVAGTVSSAGSIVVGGGHIDPGFLTLSLGPHAMFVNTGAIDVYDASNLTVTAGGPGSVFVNDGVVLSGAGFPVFDARVAGNGTFDVGPSTSGDQITFNAAVGSGEVVALSTANVDERLYLGKPLTFHAAVTGLQGSNYIDLPNTPVDAHAFANGVLTLSDQGAVVARLDLVGVSGQNLFVTERDGGTIVSNGEVPPPAGAASAGVPTDHGALTAMLAHH